MDYRDARLGARLSRGQLMLPEGYDVAALGGNMLVTGAYGQLVHVSAKQAADLAEIRRQLPALDAVGEIGLPLTRDENQLVEYLASLVKQEPARKTAARVSAA